MGLIRNKLLGIDARRKNRTPICVLVEQPGQVQEYFDKSLDLSEDGIFIETQTPCEKGTVVTLRFALPGNPVVTACGKVARVTRKKLLPLGPGAPMGMAIKFTALDPASREIIRRFITLD